MSYPTGYSNGYSSEYLKTFHDPSVNNYLYYYDSPYNREYVTEQDPLLTAYILQLNREVFADVPEGLDEAQTDLWINNQIGDIFIRILDRVRIHGWCVVINYESEENMLVLSEQERTSWLYMVDGDSTIYQNANVGKYGQVHRVGVKLKWTSPDFITFDDDVLFDDPNALFIYWEKNNYSPKPDLIPSIWNIATQIRITRDTLMKGLARPVFIHAKYGNAVDPTTIDQMESVLNDGYSAGIGATEGALVELNPLIIPIADEILPSIEQLRKEFAGVTHLPLSFYNGERTSNGLSDAGEKMGELQIRSAKRRIFMRIKPYIVQFLDTFYEEVVDSSELDLNSGEVSEDELEEEQDGEMTNGQRERTEE